MRNKTLAVNLYYFDRLGSFALLDCVRGSRSTTWHSAEPSRIRANLTFSIHTVTL
jgi:hypothetical protein